MRVSVVIPALDEAATIGPIAAAIRTELVERVALVDELVVVDDGSTDATARVARRAGARVVSCGAPGRPRGKGAAMATGLAVTSGDVVVFLDGDVSDFRVHFVTGLVGKLARYPHLTLVKATYRRSCHGRAGEGGRVTELVARPLLARFFPPLHVLGQPLSGECAVRRSALEGIELSPGYGVDVGLLIDIALAHGAAAVGEVHLGARTHRNRALSSLRTCADEVMGAVLLRAVARRGAAAKPTCRCQIADSAIWHRHVGCGPTSAYEQPEVVPQLPQT